MQPPPLNPPALPRAAASSGWWSRHWKWMVPVLVLLSAGGIFGCVCTVMAFLRSSDAYTGAVARARASAEVQAALGTPIKDGFWFTGNIAVNGASGRANMAIPLSGPKGSATIFFAATKSLGQWHYNEFVIDFAPDHRRLALPETPTPPPGPERSR